MLKISLLFRIKNAKFLGHCFYMNTNIQRDFQICINVPISKKTYVFDSDIFILFRFSYRLSLEVFSFATLFCFTTKKRYEIRQVKKGEN